MSNLTDLLPAGAGGKQVSFVASGTIGNGVTVVLNSDGTVSVVVDVSGPSSPELFESSGTSYISSAFDSVQNKLVICYADAGNSEYGTAIVGTVSGSSITFGTPVVFENGETVYTAVAFDSSNNKIVIAYTDTGNSFYGKSIVGTVSGTSISFGSIVVFNSGTTQHNGIDFDSTANKVVIAYQDQSNANNGTAIVGTVSGTSISFGSESTFDSSTGIYNKVVYDPDENKTVIFYTDLFNSFKPFAIVGTVSGTSISFGSRVEINSGSTFFVGASYDTNVNKMICVYRDGNNSGYGTAKVGSVSGTSITFGSAYVFNSAATTNGTSSFDSTENKILIAYSDGGNSSYGTAVIATISGTALSFSSEVVFESATPSYISSAYDSLNARTIISYSDGGNSNYGTSVVYGINASNNTDFIGISDAAISDTASGSVTIKGGISTNVTGLTPNATYYVQSDGSLSTTASDVLAGKALSSTSINLDYTT